MSAKIEIDESLLKELMILNAIEKLWIVWLKKNTTDEGENPFTAKIVSQMKNVMKKAGVETIPESIGEHLEIPGQIAQLLPNHECLQLGWVIYNKRSLITESYYKHLGMLENPVASGTMGGKKQLTRQYISTYNGQTKKFKHINNNSSKSLKLRRF